MLITKKRHDREMVELKKQLRIDHEVSMVSVRAAHKEKEKEFSELMEKMRVWRIRHGWNPPRGREGDRYYSITTEFSFEMMHGMVGGAPHFARMIAADLRDRVHMALLALCHIDQAPPLYSDSLPFDFNPDLAITDTEENP